jgi:hypothetical protein
MLRGGAIDTIRAPAVREVPVGTYRCNSAVGTAAVVLTESIRVDAGTSRESGVRRGPGERQARAMASSNATHASIAHLTRAVNFDTPDRAAASP